MVAEEKEEQEEEEDGKEVQEEQKCHHKSHFCAFGEYIFNSHPQAYQNTVLQGIHSVKR